jgi:hypothetical protein
VPVQASSAAPTFAVQVPIADQHPRQARGVDQQKQAGQRANAGERRRRSPMHPVAPANPRHDVERHDGHERGRPQVQVEVVK